MKNKNKPGRPGKEWLDDVEEWCNMDNREWLQSDARQNCG